MSASSLTRLLLDLTREGADDATLKGEGFSVWEVGAARAVVRRERAHGAVPVAPRADTRANPLTGAG